MRVHVKSPAKEVKTSTFLVLSAIFHTQKMMSDKKDDPKKTPFSCTHSNKNLPHERSFPKALHLSYGWKAKPHRQSNVYKNKTPIRVCFRPVLAFESSPGRVICFIHLFPCFCVSPTSRLLLLPNASAFCKDTLSNSWWLPVTRRPNPSRHDAPHSTIRTHFFLKKGLKHLFLFSFLLFGCHCSFCFTSHHKATLEAEAQSHVAAGSRANLCPARLRTKAGQCSVIWWLSLELTAFCKGPTCFCPVFLETMSPLFNKNVTSACHWSLCSQRRANLQQNGNRMCISAAINDTFK